MKYLGYIFRNAMRNKLRSFLTISSIAICLFLMMLLGAFLSVQEAAVANIAQYNRVIVMGAQGFGQILPIRILHDLRGKPGVVAATNVAWYGGKYGEEVMPFMQFGAEPESFFDVYAEFKIPEDQKKAWIEDKRGCVIGAKLAAERNFKVGDRIPLKAMTYPVDLDLTVRGIYDSPDKGQNRTLYFHWDYLNEQLKAYPGSGNATVENAGIICLKLKDMAGAGSLCQQIDAENLSSDTPTRSQTEEAFGMMFQEFLGDVPAIIRMVGGATIFALLCVGGCAMALAMRERTTEIAVLKAIGFSKQKVLFLVLFESLIVAGIGGLVGAIGSKLLFDLWDVTSMPGVAMFLPDFYIPWSLALAGLGIALAIGLLSGLIPAWNASRLSVVNGLRKVV